MKRILLLAISLVVLLAFIMGSNTAPATGQAPPTNTRRAVASLTPTNTATLLPTLPPLATPTLAATPTTLGPVSYPENINTLTGLPFPDETAKNRRNLIVKVSNYPWIVRPQSGLSLADVVYEYEVEGGVTRFAAIYRSQGINHVGPVRSGRLVDLELVVMYQALFAYSGVNDNIKKMIGEADWKYRTLTPQFGDNCPPFCRFPSLGVPFEHTLYGNTFQMWDLAERRNVNQGMPARGFAFNQTPDSGGRPASDIYLEWYGDQNARWQFNATTKKYERWNTGYPHIDALTGQQLTADNIVIIQAYHVDRPDVYESESGAKTVEIQLWGTEKAWVFRDGQWYEGLWSRRNRERGALALFYRDGKTPIMLKPGQTWVEIVRCCNMYGVTVSETYEDVYATATQAVATATARAPRVPEKALTQQAPEMILTGTASAATAQFSGPSPLLTRTPGPTGTPTPTQQVVGMVP
jgi:Protein of unknown function (DUF3048) N-terminal domain/Protein of unknown function (DUF3048) C-terminal domain